MPAHTTKSEKQITELRAIHEMNAELPTAGNDKTSAIANGLATAAPVIRVIVDMISDYLARMRRIVCIPFLISQVASAFSPSPCTIQVRHYGHSITTMPRVYAARAEGAIEADIKAIERTS